ncbi:MAG: carboxylating nicotinate-nucleotide diphosphorylase [Thermogemmatispora sp.]|jgi:nicotinate-nucleotide pyrophosphorylase (carboxylating)|uniref:carboxylating nicotinate-nucleotide diphosphorylase n=1 Tax=Thermogemmatispora sp. TaxID=1968838 RepID=UPI001D4290CD|nr:carboxylating nicotinate-nucleotide diphosphorylase [Thermogemmatispora sp.]MBX5452296.1 carboxylating nicotinate-nucleotide diphosphorylase [Thermogemmatispora sp.]
MSELPLDLIRQALIEDGAYRDLTTLCTVPAEAQAQAVLLARREGVVAGLAVALATFRLLDERVQSEARVSDGEAVIANQTLAVLSGPARALLSAERVALNFLGHLSGIATLTARCVRAVAGTGVRILDTRKTTPGLRALEKEAVRLGGGHNHRFGLSDGILIKDNHIKAAGGLTAAIEAVRRQVPHLLKIEVECETLEEVRAAVRAGADAILLDNMEVEQLRQAVAFVRAETPGLLLEASGGIGPDPERLAAVAATGVDFISLGALTHSAPNLDVALEFLT